jgi:small-conductance mechanosensitive channel
VEDIRFTYLVINTWDKRRVVVPLRYFITHPFENWTMYDAHLLKPIVLHADYEIDVNLVRISLPSYCALPTPMMKHCPLRCRW